MSKRERFGKYLLLDHLVDGGMAKICRARYLGEQADKLVVIKMVRPEYSRDENFKKMFIDEINVTFGLIHPNIVQTYDYGLQNDQLYVAMEYCDGQNLKQYIEQLKQKKFVFPVEITTYIISQVCQGLHYAHTFTDKLSGKKHIIIHRDISPHNIMLTYDGAVKVIDFGIAKSTHNEDATQAGTIKGKLSYIAPEYLEGRPLDARYDQFAVGITMWEMLCSRKLFSAENDLAVLKKIQECSITPPSSINPNVPKELDEIVLRALQKDPNKRYSNMDQFNRALMKFLYAHYPDFNGTDLGYFAKELFKEDIVSDRKNLVEFGKIDLTPYIQELKSEKRESKDHPSEEDTFNHSFGPQNKEFEFDFTETDADLTATGLERKKKTVRGVRGTYAQTNSNVRSESLRRDQTATRKLKVIEEESRPKLSKSLVASLLIALGLGLFTLKDQAIFQTLLADIPFLGSENQSKNLVTEQSTSTPSSKEKKEVVKAPKSKIRLKSFDRLNERYYLNGKRVEIGVLGELELAPDQDFVLRVEREGLAHFVYHGRSELEKTVVIDVQQTPAARFGFLYTSYACVTGNLFFELYGEQREESLPIKGRRGIPLPVVVDEEGNSQTKSYTMSYQVEGRNLASDNKIKIHFDINEDERVDLCEQL